MTQDMQLKIKNLKTHTTLGVFEWEQAAQRSVILNLSIRYNFSQAGLSDDINDAVNYIQIEEKIVNHLNHNRFNLVERLVTVVGELVMEDPRIAEVTVEVDKPSGALRFADSVALTRTFRR